MKLMILDGNSVINRAFYGVRPLTTRDGLYTNAIYGFLNILEKGFQEFLEKTDAKDLKAEYLLPTIIGGLLADGQAEVTVLQSRDKWFGVTYKEDKESVVNAIKELIESGIY